MNAVIVTIGDEILIGQIVDTNSAWMAKELNKVGVSVKSIYSISDDEKEIISTLSSIQSQEDVGLVLITGGLGPTKDDITKHTLVHYFGDDLVLNKEVLLHIKEMFASRDIPFSKLNEQQALLPSKAKILFNEVGTASGMLFQENNQIFVSMPGVPYEMKHIVSTRLIPYLKTTFMLPYISHKTYVVYGVPESEMANYLEKFENNLGSTVSLAYLPSPGRLRLRLTFKHYNKKHIEDLEKQLSLQLESILNTLDCSYSTDVSVIQIIADNLTRANLTLATAESCTGGKIATEITKVSGASKYFKGSVVAYSQEIKEKVLGVAKNSIIQHSVVSEQVAKEMALGILNLYQTDYSISVTGNAGPTTDITDETVGVVFIAIGSKQGVIVKKYNFGQPREKVIEYTKNKALELLEKEILKNYH